MTVANGSIAASNRNTGSGARAAQTATARVGAITPGMPLTATEEGCGLTVPPTHCCTQPALHPFGIGLRVLPLQRPALDNPLNRFRHIQPRTRQRGVEYADALRLTPRDHLPRVMSPQVIPEEQHPQGWQDCIALLRLWMIVPLRPGTT